MSKKVKVEKIQTKAEQLAMSEYLKEKFAELSRGQELIPVVLDRASWEGIAWSINQALKLRHKEKK
jgi:hypothetical protein